MISLIRTIALILVVIISTLLSILLCFDVVPFDEILTLIPGVLALIPLIRDKRNAHN